jgi:hypothetical protein
MTKLLRELTAINAGDMLAALGISPRSVLARPAALAFRAPARRFARRVLAFDAAVGRDGLRAASAGFLDAFADSVTVTGACRIPRTGPLLVLSNHPGMADTLALLSTIPRDDVAAIAADRPFLRALAATSRSLITVPSDPAARGAPVRAAVRHLRRGGALLTFPAGTTEPDPALDGGAAASLDRWSASAALFVRLVPDTAVVPAVVRGVLSPRAQNSLLTRLRRRTADRQLLGAMLQVMAGLLLPGRLPVRARVDYLPPLCGRDLAPLGARGALEKILCAVRGFLAEDQGKARRAWMHSPGR